MSPQDFWNYIAPVIVMLGAGGFALMGLHMWLSYRRARFAGAGREEVERLTAAVDALRDEVALMRTEHAELHERVDFAERLLTRGRVEAGGVRGAADQTPEDR